MPPSGKHRGADVIDILQECMGLLADAMTAPDAQAHMQIIQALQQGIASYVQQDRQKTRAQATGMGRPGQPGQGGQGGPPGMQGGLAGMPPGMGGQPPGGAGPSGGAMPARQIGPGGGAGMSGFGTPNPDELRRTLAGPAAIGGRAF